MIYRILLESLCDELPESSLCHLLLNLTAPSAGSLLDTVELTWQLRHWNTLYIDIIRLLPACLLSRKKKPSALMLKILSALFLDQLLS